MIFGRLVGLGLFLGGERFRPAFLAMSLARFLGCIGAESSESSELSSYDELSELSISDELSELSLSDELSELLVSSEESES